MYFKYSLVLIICTLLLSTSFFDNTVLAASSECSCSGSGSHGNNGGAGSNDNGGMATGSYGNDPSIISDPIVKVYGHWDFEGALFVYNKTDGYIQLPDEFRNNVQSFQSGIDACFVKFYPREQYQIKAGDYHKNYAALTNFGQRMDGLYAGTCSDSICPLSN